MDLTDVAVALRRYRAARLVLSLRGAEIPADVTIGEGFRLLHNGNGTVIHPDTIIGDWVTVFHGVTIGRGDAWKPRKVSFMDHIEIGDGAVICAGAKVLCSKGVLRVGKGTIVGANAVLTESTGDHQLWEGTPARMVADWGAPTSSGN